MFFECLSVMKPVKGNMISHCKDHLIHQTRIMSFVLVLEYGGHCGLKLQQSFSRRCLFSKQHHFWFFIAPPKLNMKPEWWFPNTPALIGLIFLPRPRRVCFRGIQTMEMGFFAKKDPVSKGQKWRSSFAVGVLEMYAFLSWHRSNLEQIPTVQGPKEPNHFLFLNKSPERNTKNPTR